MPIDVQRPECDTVEVHTENEKNFIKNGMVYEHWICGKCDYHWIEEIPEDEYEEILDDENYW